VQASSALTHEEANGFRTTLHQGPTMPVQMGGVPRDLAIMWWSVIMAILLAGLIWQVLPLGVLGHWCFQRATRGDPYWLHILRRSRRYKGYYYAQS